MYLRDESALTVVCSAVLIEKLQITLAVSSSHSTSPSTDPMVRGVRQGSRYGCNCEGSGMTRSGKAGLLLLVA